jgi:hypothetical protein
LSLNIYSHKTSKIKMDKKLENNLYRNKTNYPLAEK